MTNVEDFSVVEATLNCDVAIARSFLFRNALTKRGQYFGPLSLNTKGTSGGVPPHTLQFFCVICCAVRMENIMEPWIILANILRTSKLQIPFQPALTSPIPAICNQISQIERSSKPDIDHPMQQSVSAEPGIPRYMCIGPALKQSPGVTPCGVCL